MIQLTIKVVLFQEKYVKIYLTDCSFVLSDNLIYKSLNLKTTASPIGVENGVSPSKSLVLKTNAYFLLPFARTSQNSEVFRRNVIANICNRRPSAISHLKLILEPPDSEIMDLSWNDRIARLVWTRVEVEHAFSWLSTLGGAYSALGDYFEHCAEEAGRISIRQYKLSKLLGDNGLAERSKLYSALSFSQKGKLKLARHIVRNVANQAIKTRDKRLGRMCQGVWAKLKYLRALRAGTLPCKEGGDGYFVDNGKLISSY